MKLLLLAIATCKIIVEGASAYAIAPSAPPQEEMLAACPFCYPDPPPDDC
jgi:hypothetical protein